MRPESTSHSLRARVGQARHWTTSLPLAHRAVAGSFVLATLVAAMFGLLILALSHLQSSTDVQARSRDVTSATLGAQSAVNDLESSLRAYIFTGDTRFLTSWRRSRAELRPAFTKVANLLQGQPDESHQVGSIEYQTFSYISEYGEPLIGIYNVSPSAARAPVATKEGVTRIDLIRADLDRLLAGEAALASADAASAKRQAGMAVNVGTMALVAAVALLIAYGVFLVRGIVGPARAVAAGAEQVASGDLSTRLPEQGAAEIRTLTHAFNAMARSLEQGKRALEAQNEELRQSERLKSQLVSIVSHELRNPLTSILGYTTLLRSRQFPPEQVDRYLEVIHQQGERLGSMIDRFLDAESVESGKIELADTPFDLRPVLAHEAQLAADKATAHRIELDTPEPLSVRGDRDRVAQVFANLLDNAVKYSPGGEAVHVSAEAAGGLVRVTVRDHGIGVPEEHRSRIFSKFFRGNAQESGIAGTGLGLAVSREIVEAHGGRMGFESRDGKGSSFWFELPLVADAQPPARAKPPAVGRRRAGSSRLVK
jgi:signal transduction histidine kinase